MSSSYRPSNGTEGMIFEEKFCEQCKHYNDGNCIIWFNAGLHEINEPEYPKEWVYNAENEPTCTAFEEAPQ